MSMSYIITSPFSLWCLRFCTILPNFYFLSLTNFLRPTILCKSTLQTLQGSPNSLPLDFSLACPSRFIHKYLLLNFYLFFKEEGQMLSNTFLLSLCPCLRTLFPCQNSVLLLPNRLPLRNLPGLPFPELTK